MNRYLKIFLFYLCTISLISGDCSCGDFQPNPVTTTGQNAFLQSPEDSSTGKQCIPSNDCTYQFAYAVSDNIGITANIFSIKNFKSSGATLSFYDGITATGTPYMIVDGSYDNSKTVNVISSLGKNITVVFSVTNKNGDIPIFTCVTQSTTNLRTTTLPPTTTTPIPASPYPIKPDSFQSEGDILIHVDLSANIKMLSQIGGEIINALYINTDETSFSSRVYFTMASDTFVYPFGWKNSKTFFQNQFKNLPDMGAEASTIEWNKLGVIFEKAFTDSVSQRPNVQRTLIILTDNNNQTTDAGSSQYKNIINKYDVHPVVISVDSSKDVSTFSTILGIFNGDDTNQIVKVNYNNVTDLFENYLFNSNVMCNLKSSLNAFNGTNSFQFPKQSQSSSGTSGTPGTTGAPVTPGTSNRKNYCNYMNYTIKCISSNNSPVDITIKLNEYDFEANSDYLTVYNDQGVVQAAFTGTSVTDSTEVIKNTKFVELVLSTNNHRVYPGVDIQFTNCNLYN